MMNMSRTKTALKPSLDTAPGPLLITDEYGKAVYANAAVTLRTGFDLGEIIGRKPGQLWGGQMPQRFYADLWYTLQERQKPFLGFVRNRRKHGQVYDETLAIAPICRGKGIIYYLALWPRRDTAFETFAEEWGRFLPTSSVAQPLPGLASLLRWTGAHNTPDYRIHQTTHTLADALYHALIAPLETSFRRRREDRDLVAAAQANPQAFGLLYEKYRDMVFGYYVRHVPGQEAVAEDLTHDTFYQALTHLPRFQEGNAAYGTYLLSIAHNLLINHFRRQSRVMLSIEDEEAGHIPITARVEAETDRSLDWIGGARVLSVPERQALTLFYGKRRSIRDIARTLGKTDNAVKLLLSRGRKKLRRLLVS